MRIWVWSDLLFKSRKGRSIASKTEDNEVSSDVNKEEKTLEDDINLIENDEDILEIDDESDVQNVSIAPNIKDNINDEEEDLEINEDGLEEKDNLSIELDDENDDSTEEKN